MVDSTEDLAYHAVSHLLSEFKDDVDAKVIVAGPSTTCSQKIHNQLIFLNLQAIMYYLGDNGLGLADRSTTVVEQCLALIKDEWLMKSCSRDPIVLLSYLDVETYELVGESVMEVILNINIGKSVP
ncbi:hypothetical protein POM88_049034 [Heracleum sosnowskyi]|uniref:Uncharacterized protein n=1 Tax=Heracleum sosnowskyi TaxID=360622 RepID=A0AAD8GWF4_9APIA|nr:hypothetical protein POM88_049034 [Heracleum sosnowskyi]